MSLPDDDLELLRDRFRDGLDAPGIANKYGVSPAAVLHRFAQMGRPFGQPGKSPLETNATRLQRIAEDWQLKLSMGDVAADQVPRVESAVQHLAEAVRQVQAADVDLRSTNQDAKEN